MADPKWYTKVKPPRSRLVRFNGRERDSLIRETSANPYKKKITQRKPSDLHDSRYNTLVIVNGMQVKLVSRYQLAKFLGVRYNTVTSWYLAGVFGDPFMVKVDKNGRECQYWLVKQMMCFIRVLNDLLQAGYLNFDWSRLPEAVEVIHNGFDHYADLFGNKLDQLDTPDKNITRFGIEFLES